MPVSMLSLLLPVLRLCRTPIFIPKVLENTTSFYRRGASFGKAFNGKSRHGDTKNCGYSSTSTHTHTHTHTRAYTHQPNNFHLLFLFCARPFRRHWWQSQKPTHHKHSLFSWYGELTPQRKKTERPTNFKKSSHIDYFVSFPSPFLRLFPLMLPSVERILCRKKPAFKH